MGYAARANQRQRAMGAAPERVIQGPSGPRLYHLRMQDAFGAIYRVIPHEREFRNAKGGITRELRPQVVRAVTKVRGKAARRADKQARRLGRPQAA